MLQSLLRSAAGAGTAAIVFAACASADGTDDGAIRENVIEPGITAMDDASDLACDSEARGLFGALEAYELLEGEPAETEQDLVDEAYMRSESELWDVADGAIVVAEGSGCTELPEFADTSDIVTIEESADDSLAADIAAATPADILAGLTDAEIAEVGGPDCAYEVAVVSLAFGRWTFENQTEPDSLLVVTDDPAFEPLSFWELTETSMLPVDGTTCLGPIDLLAPES